MSSVHTMRTHNQTTTIPSASNSSSPSSVFISRQQHRNPSSLLPDACHNPGFLYIVTRPVTRDMVKWVAQTFLASIDVDEDAPQSMLPTPPATPKKSVAKFVSTATTIRLPPLEEYIARLVQRTGAHVATLLSTLIYLERLCAVLPKQRGIPCSRHRVFLATFVVAAKYLNDSSPKNRNWTDYAPWFTISEVNLMELQLLGLLDYRLRFTEEEACKHFAPFLSNVEYDIRQSAVPVIGGSTQLTVARGMTGKDPLTPSPSVIGILSQARAVPHPVHTPHKRRPQKLFMPLLMAAKNHRSWTRCHRQYHHHRQQRNSSFSTPEMGMSSSSMANSSVDGQLCKLGLPQIDTMEGSSSFLSLELVNGLDMLSLSSPPSSSSETGSSQTTFSDALLMTSRIHGSGDVPCPEIPCQATAHLPDSVPLLLPSTRPEPSSLLFNNNHLEAATKSSAVKNQLDSFFRKMFSHHAGIEADKLQDHGVFHEEKPCHVSVPPFKDFLPVAIDPTPEPMVVC